MFSSADNLNFVLI